VDSTTSDLYVFSHPRAYKSHTSFMTPWNTSVKTQCVVG
jgi:hypothetical protein